MDASVDVGSSELIRTLASLKPVVASCLIIGIVVYVVGNRLFTWLDSRAAARKEELAEAAKERRAQAYLEAVGSLGKGVESLGQRIETYAQQGAQASAHLDNEVGEIQHVVRRMHSTVKDLRDRTAHVISTGESLAIIEGKFDDYVRNEAVTVLDQSIRRNAYAERRAFVQERVKTALGEVVTRAKDSLERDYKALSVDLSPFFPVRGSGTGGERFTLVDTLWDRIEPLYDVSRDVEGRLEEMRVAVRNVVADHVALARTAASDLYSNCHLNESSTEDRS